MHLKDINCLISMDKIILDNEEDPISSERIYFPEGKITHFELYKQKENERYIVTKEVFPFELKMNNELLDKYSLIELSARENASVFERKECIEEVFLFLKSRIENKNPNIEILPLHLQ